MDTVADSRDNVEHRMLRADCKDAHADLTGLDKGGYLVSIFLISPQKHILWVLIRSASVRRF